MARWEKRVRGEISEEEAEEVAPPRKTNKRQLKTHGKAAAQVRKAARIMLSDII